MPETTVQLIAASGGVALLVLVLATALIGSMFNRTPARPIISVSVIVGALLLTLAFAGWDSTVYLITNALTTLAALFFCLVFGVPIFAEIAFFVFAVLGFAAVAAFSPEERAKKKKEQCQTAEEL